MLRINVNGRWHETDADPATPLLYLLRGELGLNGAKYGCGLGQCGSCAVLYENKRAFSCLLPIAAIEGREIVTLEGLGTVDAPGRVQAAFLNEQAAQCGYCIPGMIVAVEGLLRADPDPDEAAIRRALEPHLCRCGTHERILRAARRAAGRPEQTLAQQDTP
ncbi:(2Fe-2S)-binding protein [Aureimonas jatrophae]|jgi:nicotinate dehydrogenase subunit A|uniref:Aerobic-type carbon monoxide dehydrogenase, small subunit, CoxS/CutS family n=1 Tax=Aureimonas jatrophae TaxID=1166073 RepID=A0A1H0BUS5_9HYPH|nr:(2Fe-2S)-binding protein [Aureimonas jatrophae]MBB3948937.1 aerobic-type carbon monoxide dehydrogenase small subunit (CoxS/CutS family) [Aureimonas jatrophae]SDN49327.1 Aerobic-type carbon monoxide dehydrogenase, small subunit, CoxS/CutS family [Aureimonas jatrophae]